MRFALVVMVAFRTVGFLLAASALIAADSSQNASPFLPPAGATAPASKEPSAYSLAGMTVVGGETLLSITRESDKRSTWVPVGKTVGDITAVSYDAKKDEAVIRADGHELTLPMRKSVVLAASARPPAPSAPPVTHTPAAPAPAPEPVKMPPLNQQEEKEMEARMLVSDLLEIGLQQRRAYEAAQREAAAKAAADARAKAATP